MANSQSRGMRVDEFAQLFLKPAGFELERDNGAHSRLYRHVQTGVMFGLSCDEGAFAMSSPRVDTARKDLARDRKSVV